jgi:hypothetical protein
VGSRDQLQAAGGREKQLLVHVFENGAREEKTEEKKEEKMENGKKMKLEGASVGSSGQLHAVGGRERQMLVNVFENGVNEEKTDEK